MHNRIIYAPSWVILIHGQFLFNNRSLLRDIFLSKIRLPYQFKQEIDHFRRMLNSTTIKHCFIKRRECINVSTNIFKLRRSEEHTSELQSRFDLVCRLLLEKKKYKPYDNKFVYNYN